MKRGALLRNIGVCVLAFVLPNTVKAGSDTWFGGGSDSAWETPGNWYNGTPPNGSLEIATIYVAAPTTLSTPVTVNWVEYWDQGHVLTIADTGSLMSLGGFLTSGYVNSIVNHGALSLPGGTSYAFPTITNHGTVTVSGTASMLHNYTVPDDEDEPEPPEGEEEELPLDHFTNGGTLQISGSASLSGVVITNTGSMTLSGGAAIAGSLIVNENAYDELDPLHLSPPVSRGSLTISDSASVSGGILINDGYLAVSANGLTGSVAFTNRDLGEVNFYGSQSLGSLGGAGVIRPTAPTSTMTVGSLNTDTVFSGTIDDQGNGTNFAKVGTGTLTVDGFIQVSGAIVIDGGQIVLGENGVVFAPSVTVASGGTFDVSPSELGFTVVQSLAGAGTLRGSITIADGAHLAPGDSAGTITFADGLTLSNGAVLDFDLGSVSDLIRVTDGTLVGSDSAGGITLNLSAVTGFGAATYPLFDFAGAELDGFDLTDFLIDDSPGGYAYALAFDGQTLALTATAIPEPSTYAALAGAAALAWVVLRRGRRRVV